MNSIPSLVDYRERGAIVNHGIAPVRVRAPTRRIEHEPGSVGGGKFQEPAIISAQAVAPVRVVEQDERREARQIEAVLEDHAGLEPGIGQKRGATQARNSGQSSSFVRDWHG